MRSIARCARRAEALAELPVERQVELGQLALEVEVELAPRLVETAGRLQHPRRDPRGELLERLLGVVLGQVDPDQAARRGGEQQRPEGRVDVA